MRESRDVFEESHACLLLQAGWWDLPVGGGRLCGARGVDGPPVVFALGSQRGDGAQRPDRVRARASGGVTALRFLVFPGRRRKEEKRADVGGGVRLQLRPDHSRAAGSRG